MSLILALLLQTELLERKISIEARGTFREIFEKLREASGANVHLLPKTETTAHSWEIVLKEVRALTAFRWLASAYGLAVREREGVLVVGSLLQTTPLVSRFHESRGVFAPLVDHRGPALSWPGPHPLHLQLDPVEPSPLSDRSEHLIDLLKENVAPGTWEGDVSIERTLDDRLLVRHRPDVQEEIRWLLDVLRRFAPSAVDVSVEIAEMEETSDGPAILSPEEAERLSARLQAAGARPIRASGLNTQLTHAAVHEDGPVLVGYRNGAPQPRKAPVDASVLEVRPTLIDDGARVILDLKLSLGHAAAGEASLSVLRTSLLVPRGGGARVVLPARSPDGRSRIGLVRASWTGGKFMEPQILTPLKPPSPLFDRLEALPATDVDFAQAPMSDVAAWLRRVSGLNVVVLPAAAGRTIDLRARNVKPAAALRLLYDYHGLRAIADEEVVGLTLKDAPESGIRTLLLDARAAAYSLPRFDPPGGDQPPFTGEDIANLLKNTIHREHWEEADGRSVHFVDGALILRNHPEVLTDCVAFVEEHRRVTRRALAFRAELLTLDATKAAGPFVDAAERARLLEGARVESVAWSGWAGQMTSVTWDRTRAHAWDVEGDDLLLRGQLTRSFLEIMPDVEKDGSVQLALRFQDQTLRRLEKRDRIELPVVDTATTTTSLRIPEGRWAALRFGLPSDGKVRLLLLTATPLSQ